MAKKDQTTSTNVPPATPQEQELLNLVSGTLLPDYLREAGYDVKVNQINKVEDTKAYRAIKSEMAEWRKNNPNAQQGAEWKIVKGGKTYDEQLNELSKNFKPGATTYDVGEKLDPQGRYLKEKYGEDSQQLKTYKAKQVKSEADSFKQQQEVYKEAQSKAQKYLRGDYTLTDKEQKRLTESNKSVRASLDNIFKDTLDETTKAYGDFSKKAGEAGMTVGDALGAVGAQIEKTGIDMNKALDNVVKTRGELLKQGIEDATGEITKKVSVGAASAGRDPTDPEFQADIQQIVAKEVRQGQLQLADMESTARLGIAERTGAGYENVAQQQAQERLNVAKTKSGVLSSLDPRVSGQIPQQLAIAQGSSQYSEALAQQRLANASGNMGPAMNLFSSLQRERLANASNKTNEGAGGWWKSALGGVGAFASIYGSVAKKNEYDNASSDGGGGREGSAYGDYNSGNYMA